MRGIGGRPGGPGDLPAGAGDQAPGMGYFAMAGAFSVWAYELLKGLAHKEGIDIDLPGVDDSTPPAVK